MSIPTTVAPRIQTYTAKLTDKNVFNDIFTLFHFELVQPSRIQFQAGQYVLLSVPGTPQKKSYSIVSSPDTEHAIELLVDLRPQGDGTKYLSEIEIGADISFMGPVGMFTVPDRSTPVGQNEDTLWFVATGSGIAPFRSMIEDLLIHKEDSRPITLLWGLRHAEDQCWFDDFSRWSEQYPNFSFRPVLSQAPEDWPLDRGRVTDVLVAHQFPDITRTGFFLCGSSSMIEDSRKILSERGAVETQVHREKFF